MPMLRGFESSSGISGNDSGVYTGITGSLARSNNGGAATRVQYRPQLGGILLDPSATLLSKRPSPDIDYQLVRKQPRSNHSPWISGYSVPASDRPIPFPAYQQQQAPSGGICEDSIRNRLQELERALLDDDDDGGVGHDDGGLESEIIDGSNDWKETMQSLLSSCSSSPSPPPAFSPSPPSACSSTSPAPMPSAEPKQLILDTLVALSEGRADNALAGLARARQLCNPRSGDPEQRLLAHVTRAIASRSNPPEVRAPGAAELSSPDHLLATQMLYEASPCFKLGFMAANLAILEAVRDRNRIHIIDFDIGQGNQYATLIQALAERQSGRPASLRITAVVIDAFSNSAGASGPRMVGDRLEKLAERYGLRCSFHVVSGWRLGELNRARLGCSSSTAGTGEEEEAVAVNFAYRLYRVADESVSTENPRDEMLRLARGLRPVVVTIVEQVMNGNTAPLVTRFGEVVGYYRALIESLDATMAGGGKEGEERGRVEECLGRRAANAVACEGWERVERCEVAGKWGARLEMAGFRPRPLGPHVHALLLAKLRSYQKPGFTLKDDAGGLCFGWNDRVLTHASAWH
ncbi:Scarecrow-like protein 8 [Nymphaea thermarum]|nr:Scarecrow-like protein 8 [Nymphaea thermarum]